MAKIIAVDFDGTLCERKYPDIGAPITPVIEYVKERKAAGDIIILWTCRVGVHLENAVEWCKRQGLTFDYINENAPERVGQYGGDTRKISADEYIDDKANPPSIITIRRFISMTSKRKKINAESVAENIYDEVAAIIANHAEAAPSAVRAGYDELREDIDALFEEQYGIATRRKNIENMTWREIAEIAATGEAQRHFKIGDTKDIVLYTGERVKAVILGFNHDILSENGRAADKTAGITFGLKDLLDGEYEMNEDFGNAGGWKKSKMRNVYMPRFLSLLPAELRDEIKPVVKLTGTGGGSDDVTSTDDKLFLFSQAEVCGDSTYTADGEGEQYEYFKDAANRVKRRGGSANSWWLRSPNVSGSTIFRYIFSTGGVSYHSANFAYGVSFGFCV
jgi:hypothetical protein